MSNKPSNFDVGPLTWVKGEIDQALERSREALRTYFAHPDDSGSLKAAQKDFHNVHGALQIVGLDGVTRLCEEVEGILAEFAESGAGKPSPTAEKAVKEAYIAVGRYLEELIAGEPNQPLKLYTIYADLVIARGRAPDPIDLYYPDLSRRPPRREHPAIEVRPEQMPLYLRRQRARYQRGLLKWLRQDWTGVEGMRVAVAAVEAVQTNPAQRAFWWVALGFFDALAGRAVPAQPAIQRLCNRIEQQLKRVIEGPAAVAERLMREALFTVARAKPVTDHVRHVHEVYELGHTIPESLSVKSDAAPQPPAMRAMRELVNNAKATWNKIASGHRASLSLFRDQAEQIAGHAVALGEPSLRALTEQLSTIADWATENPERCDDTVAMEVATTLLLSESAIEAVHKPNDQFAEQARIMSERLHACMAGTTLPSAAPVPVLDEMSRRAQERLLMSQVVAEIQASLRAIEQALDAFFRDASKRDELNGLDKPVRQVMGALTMLNEDRAAAALAQAAADIQRFTRPDYQPTEDDFEGVAGALSGLGFYVEALQHGNANFDAMMNPIGAGGSGESGKGSQSVETEIGAAKRELERQFEAWRHRPDDARMKEALRSTLTAIQKDAGLVADRPLERRVAEMLSLLDQSTAKPFDAEVSQVMQSIAPSTAVTAPSPEAAAFLSASDEKVDAELLSVYLEEAGEVLATIAEHRTHAMAHPQDVDVMRTIRRGFHTLKGSGRMVGLTRLGEAAWAVEQVMNRFLEDERPASPDLLRLIEYAHEFFTRAVAMLKASGQTPDESTVVAAAEKVKAGEPLGESLPPIAAAVEAAPGSPVQLPNGLDFLISTASAASADDTLDFTPVDSSQAEGESVWVGEIEMSGSLYRIFIDEARSLIARMREMRSQPGMMGENFRRAAHTLNGITATTRIEAIGQVAVAFEHLLNRIGANSFDRSTEEVVDDTLAYLYGMVEEVAERRLPSVVPDLVARLDALHAQDAPIADMASSPVELDFSGMMETLPGDHQLGAAAERAAPAPATPEPLAGNVLSFPVGAPDTPMIPIGEDHDEGSAGDRRARITDDLDLQLLPIFMEEAQELMPAIGTGLRDWRDNPSNTAAGHSLQRTLHTIKGSARMAGAMIMGELTHAMETRVENAMALRNLPATLFDELENAYDRLGALYEALQNPQSPAPKAAEDPVEFSRGVAEPESAAAETQDATAEARAPATPVAAPGTAVAPDEAEVAAQQRAVLRVRADTIDRLVNEAGEVSIARSRIEGEMRNLKFSVHDLTENVSRLRAQLREIEIQAESQMQSKMSLAQEKHIEFDPLEMDRFSRFQELTRMMAESVNDVSTVHNNLLKALDEADAALMAQARMTRDLQGDLMRIRMVPFSSITERLYRVVRQATKDSGKRAVLDIRGAQAELDRSVLERITAPFEHMLRNCVAHGIEAGNVRTSRGKPEVGEIKVEVRQEGNEVMLAVMDDGAGLDYDRIRAKAQSLGLIPPNADLSETDIAEFIFHPGFSTASEVTQLSGRGVGMDVVKSEISALGGRVDTASTPGQGTRFTIFLPLTLAVTQAVLVRAGGTVYAVPSVMVEQIRSMKAEELARSQQAGEARWQDRSFPFRYLPYLLGDPAQRPEPQRITPVLFARSGSSHAAVQIDEVIGNQEIVVKNTGPLLARIVGITGATVLGTGEIVLIINPVVLASHDHGLTRPVAPVVQEAEAVAPTIMIVDDSLTVRKITGRLLAREGYQVLTAKDGVDAMEQLQEARPDVMLVDIEMPRMDGFDLTRNIRNDVALKNIPIIMITSRTAEKHRNYAAQIGVNVYLGKPYQEDQLLEHIAAFVKRPQLV
jgi:chemosensory pili system protein ChpA (sensor histidine kinase/response regulator)